MAELPSSSQTLPEGTLTKLERVAPLVVTATGEGFADAARDAWQHKARTATELGVTVGVGAALAVVQASARFPRLVTEIGALALGSSALTTGVKQCRAGVSAVCQNWQSAEHQEQDGQVIKASFGTFAFDSTLVFTAGSLGAIGARTIPVAIEERSILRDMNNFHPETAEHSIRTGQFAQLTARQMGLPYGQQRRVFHAGLMHDAGKLDMPLKVLGKTSGALTPEDLEIVHQHPLDSLARLQKVPYKGALQPVPEDAAMHHEWVNGGGYPRGLSTEQIPVAARAIPPADVFDAVTAGRAYNHERMPLAQVKTMMDSGKGTHFDALALDALWKIPADKAISVLESGPHRAPVPGATLRLFRGTTLGRILDVTNGASSTPAEQDLASLLNRIYQKPPV